MGSSGSNNDKQPGDGKSAVPIQRALDGLLEGCSLLGFNWAYLYVNDAAAQQSHQPRENLIGRTIHEVFPTAVQTEFFQACRVAMEQRIPQRFEATFTFPDGTTHWFETSAEPVPDGIFLFTLDITKRKEAQKALVDAFEFSNNLIASMQDGFSVLDQDGRALDANPALCLLTGFSRAELVGESAPFVYWPPEEYETIQAAFQKTLKGVIGNYELTFMRKNGERFPVTVSPSVVRDRDGNIVNYTAIVKDNTERKLAEEELRLAALVYQASSEAMLITDTSSTIISVNPAYTHITGYAPEEVIGKKSDIFRSARHDEAFFQSIWQEVLTTGTWHGEIWNRRKNGEEHPAWLTLNASSSKDGSLKGYVMLFSDITKQKASEELIWKQANFDTLTGLPNRRMLHDRLQQEIRKAQRNNQPLALMFLDLDHFKEVNDTLGHDIGDILLKEAAQRLTSCVRESDTVGRTGGDEFTVILGGLDDPGCVERIAEKILKTLAEPFPLGDDKAYVSTSIGITLYPDDADNIDALLKNADQAMYAAKNLGRNRYCYFTPAMQEAAQRRMRLAFDLRDALAGHQFQLYYQPIVNMATGFIHKAEALIRWQHPTRGWVSPVDFIPIAEDTGMIVEIGDWVFREAARQAGRWCESHHAQFQISVNVSPVQFKRGRNSEWFDYLQQLGLSGKCIAIEITEGLLLDASAGVTEQLSAFCDAGFQVSLDDFGTGYSALSYLKKFDIDFLKIDQSFVRNLAPNSADMALCEAIILMAHKLGILVIAEGVETIEQRDLLAAAGCDYAQGYLYSRPVPPQDFEQLLLPQNPRL
jgi:diguanylate cyclase (GGDEF)-like protein/PAS domain S-box-containing protein